MPTYVLLTTLTSEGRRSLHSNPDRLEEVNDEIADFGVQVIFQYALLGPYDFITIVDAPDNETVAHLAVALGSRGTVNIMSMPAVSIPDLLQKIIRQ